MSITYPVFLPVPIKSDRFGLNINKSQFSGEFVRNRIAQSHGAGTTDGWEGVYTTPFLNREQHRDMSALLNSMSVDAGTFFAFNPNNKSLLGTFPDHNLLGSDADATHSFTGKYLYRTDFPISYSGFKIGDPILFVSSIWTSGGGSDQVRIQLIFFDKDRVVIQQNSVSGTIGQPTPERKTITTTIPAGTVFIGVEADDEPNNGATYFTQTAVLIKGTVEPTFKSSLRINGASQTGTSLNIDNAPTSENGVLRRGALIQIETQFYEIAQRADSDGSGELTIEVRPAIKAAHPDNEEIVVRNPVMIAELVKTDHPQETNHNSIGVISFAWQEKV